MSSGEPTSGHVRVTVEDGVVRAELTRPEARNALSGPMLADLARAVDLTRESGAAVLTLTGQGSSFCAGADIALYAHARGDRAQLEPFTRTALALGQALEDLDAVVVAGVQGACLGGGLELVLCADLVVAGDDARFGLPELRLGLIPGWGGTQRLTRAVGPHLARSLILRSQTWDAARAAAVGLVTDVVPAAEVAAATAALASQLSAGPVSALLAAKQAIRAADELTAAGLAAETGRLLQLFGSVDGLEGVSAFLAKRPPQFSGPGQP